MTINRSAEEFEMRRTIEAWGREKWPRSRVVHELVIANECRIDMAFIEPTNIVGVEIKSSRDTLDRFENQMRVFSAHIPLVIAAVAPKWLDEHNWFIAAERCPNWVICAGGRVESGGYIAEPRREITAQMLALLWADEARAIAARAGIRLERQTPLYKVVPMLARALTGDEIVRETCRELRARDAFPRRADHPPSDSPIYEAAQ